MADSTPTQPERADRTGKKTLVIYLHPDMARRLRIMAAATDKSMQEVGVEAVEDWLEKNENLVVLVEKPPKHNAEAQSEVKAG